MTKNNEPRERSLILYPHEVRGILEGRISQIRRPVGGCSHKSAGTVVGLTGPDTDDIQFDTESGEWYCNRGLWHKRCPLGQPGDLLVGKEAWAQPGTVARSDDPVREDGRIVYRADADESHSWRSPVTMPRWASRITLKVEAVRVQKVQEASEEDCIAEGVEALEASSLGPRRFLALARTPTPDGWIHSALMARRAMWELHSPDDWSSNPWTLVAKVSRINKEQP